MNCCRGVSIHSGSSSTPPPASATAYLVNATPNTVANPSQVYTTPSAYVSGTLGVWDGSVLTAPSDIIEVSPTTFRLPYTPVAGHTLRCLYEEL